MHIVTLTASDVAQYRGLLLEAYELATDAFTSTAAERQHEPESFWVKRIADPSGMSVAFGAFENEELVGTVALEFSAKPKIKHKALVIGMYVRPKARGLGAGSALLLGAINYARSKPSLRQLTLTVTEGNLPAVKLYTNAGFETFGIEPAAILTPSGYKAKVYMWKTLQTIPPALSGLFDPE
jgi:ribosomal protein S18 acetylase RimI-like enzyme